MLGHLSAAHNWLCDRRLGIRTTGESRPPDTTLHRDAAKSSPLSYGLIRRYARVLRLGPGDVIYDIGCGTGRPLCVFARHGIARCIGIEMDPGTAEIARTNALQLAGRRADIAIVEGDAASADYRGGTVFWLYSPFGKRTLAAVLEQIRANVTVAPRNVRFCYVNPEHEQVFSASGWLTRYNLVRPVLHQRYSASFWHNASFEATEPSF